MSDGKFCHGIYGIGHPAGLRQHKRTQICDDMSQHLHTGKVIEFIGQQPALIGARWMITYLIEQVMDDDTKVLTY